MVHEGCEDRISSRGPLWTALHKSTRAQAVRILGRVCLHAHTMPHALQAPLGRMRCRLHWAVPPSLSILGLHLWTSPHPNFAAVGFVAVGRIRGVKTQQ